MKSLRPATKQVKNLTQHSNDSTVNYFKIFKNTQKVLESCEGSLTQEGLLKYGFKLLLYDMAGG